MAGLIPSSIIFPRIVKDPGIWTANFDIGPNWHLQWVRAKMAGHIIRNFAISQVRRGPSLPIRVENVFCFQFNSSKQYTKFKQNSIEHNCKMYSFGTDKMVTI